MRIRTFQVGEKTAETREAVKKYLAGRGQQSAAPAITDEFVSDLKAQRQRACEPVRPVASRAPAKPVAPKPRRQQSQAVAVIEPAATCPPAAAAPAAS